MSEPTTQIAQANEVTEAVEQTKPPTSITNGASPASEQPVASSSKPKKHASSKPPRAGPSPDVLISKALAYLLRHGAVKEKLPIRGDGYIPLDAVLEKARLRQIDMITDPTDCTKNGKKKVRKPSADDVKRVVDTPGDKKRFELTADENGQTLIRAMQGHSIVAVTELDHTPITLDTLSILAYDNEVPTVQGQLPQGVETLHGTTLAVWHQIEQEREGLKKMKRNHVHLARGRPRDDNDDSGTYAVSVGQMQCQGKETDFISATLTLSTIQV